MSEGFVHLHVASGYSMRFGAATPADLVSRAAAWGQPALALTDRDGLYGAVKFVQACQAAGVAPILGVDLAVPHTDDPGRDRSAPRQPPPTHPTRNPVRGGQLVDPRHPRITVLARGSAAGLAPGSGWAQLCRLVTDAHLGAERGSPRLTPEQVAGWVTRPDEHTPALLVLLGPDSDVGRAVLAGRLAQARTLLARWQRLLPRGALAIETVCHGGPEGSPASLGHAARLLALARQAGLPCVLTAAVRHADPGDGAIVDVLDAARRLVPLHPRHLDRTTNAAYLAPTAAMYAIAQDIVQASGPGISGGGALAIEGAKELLATTCAIAMDCIQDPRADLGIGSVQLPEPGVLGIAPGTDPHSVLARRCREAVATRYAGQRPSELSAVGDRLEDELETIRTLGYASYFLTVARVCDLIKEMGIRVAARGSGAGSLVNYLLGISGVDPMRYGLLMERFCTPLRAQLPDIDIDVESARRTEIYERILAEFGGERVSCVSMMDTYRVRHAIRDVGAALGLPPGEIDAMAKAFPHIAARNARQALADLPELRASGLNAPRLAVMLDLVERLDGLPRHIALHPCGMLLSNSGLLDRTPVEASWIGFPMSQFDKDDVEAMGFLKLDVLGIRMQSAMAYAVDEIERVDGIRIDLDNPIEVPFDDPQTFEMIRSTRTLGCFQIESPGQRELIGKFGPVQFEDLIIDISLFRPGPVKSDMIVPFLNARHGWSSPEYLHPSLEPALRETEGVVVFHEQVLKIIAVTTGVDLAQADEVRRALGSPAGQDEIERWWRPAARDRGYRREERDRIWAVLKAFASFGFCKAHAAAFALPTYHSAWLKAHHPAAFLAGVLTHDPGMYPKRLILDDARSFGVTILGLDVNASGESYRLERLFDDVDLTSEVDPAHAPLTGVLQRPWTEAGQGYGIRISLTDVKGISADEVASIAAAQPFANLADFWKRTQVSRTTMERLVLAGGFDSLHGIETGRPDLLSDARLTPVRTGVGRRGQLTRRDLLLHVAYLDAWRIGPTSRRRRAVVAPATDVSARAAAQSQAPLSRRPSLAASPLAVASSTGPGTSIGPGTSTGTGTSTGAGTMAAASPAILGGGQLALDFDTPVPVKGFGLPEMTAPEVVRAELDILGLDASGHVMSFYSELCDALGVVRAKDLLTQRSNREIWVAGVKVATQTPPIRSGRRVIFLTLDDATGPVDATFFEDVQGPYATTVFHSWMLLVRGVVRRTGSKGVSLRATGAWDLGPLWQAWSQGGLSALEHALAEADTMARERAASVAALDLVQPKGRRVLVHASGFKQSPYADIRPAGGDPRSTGGLGAAAGFDTSAGTGFESTPRKLWHSSPGSAGH